MSRPKHDVAQARAPAGEWDRDRVAWNLPRPTSERTAIPPLPDDVSALRGPALQDARDKRDAQISSLFRRWPALTAIELREARRLSDESQRLAKHAGALRRALRADDADS
jgi:hypothetical protein